MGSFELNTMIEYIIMESEMERSDHLSLLDLFFPVATSCPTNSLSVFLSISSLFLFLFVLCAFVYVCVFWSGVIIIINFIQ